MDVPGLVLKNNRNDILEELVQSKLRNNVLGLFIKGDDEMLTTSVVNVTEAEEGDKFVYFQFSDLHGYEITRNPVLLSEIKSVIRFQTLFNDPVYVKIRQRNERSNDDLAA